jgi:hypothetical protein
MTTNNPTTIRIAIAGEGSDDCTLVIERAGLATMVQFSMRHIPDGAYIDPLSVLRAIGDGFKQLGVIEAAPPPDVKIEDPKPAPKPAAGTVTPKRPAAPPPPLVKAKWWVEEDTGKVYRDDKPEEVIGVLGPFDSREVAESHIPEWLKSSFGKSKKRK